MANAQHLTLSAEQIRAAGITTVQPQLSPARGNEQVLNGYFSSARQGTIAVSSLETATVSEVFKDNLSEVKAGDVVLRVMSESWLRYQQEHLQNRTALNLAQQNAKRDKVLLEEGLIPQRRHDDTMGQLSLARANHDGTRQRLKLTGASEGQIRQLENGGQLAPALSILSPATGSLNMQSLALGQQIAAGSPLFQVIKPGALELVLSASPEQAKSIRTGQAVKLKDCTGQEGPLGKVQGVSQQLSEGNQSVAVRVRLGSKTKALDCFKLNQYTQATVQSDADPSNGKADWLVPSKAVVLLGRQAYVFSKAKTGFDAIQVQARSVSTTHHIVQSDALGSSSELAISGTALLKGTLQGLGAE